MIRRLLIGLLALSGVTLLAQSPAKKLTADDLKQALEDKDAFFLDVREPKELEELGTIKGYVNIPIGQLEARLSEVPKNKRIIVACEHGRRASRGAEILAKNGYRVTGACGLADWREKNYPVVYPKAAAKK